jgi:PBSX family phage terminase large subunit
LRLPFGGHFILEKKVVVMAVGRPPRYKNVEEVEILIEKYFEDCKGTVLKDEDGAIILDKYKQPIILNFKPPTVTGLAIALGFTSRQAILKYQDKPEFVDAITRAKARVHEYAEMRLFDRDGARGAEFSLRCNYGWKPDESAVGEQMDKESKYTGLPAEILGKMFVDPYRYILSRKYSDFDFEGGRGSLKSSFCGMVIIDQIERNPNFCALAVRQLKDNLFDSVFSQIVWAIDMLGLSDDYRCTKSPMLITKISTGQKIYFRGGDDPKKIKSIKPPKGMHIGVIWIEEADQLKGEDALRDIKQSAFRGGDEGILLRSYNVPRSQHHFINKEKRESNPKRLIHKSHFLQAPKEWLGQRFHDDAERLKSINPKAYAHEYDGEAVGNGFNVFDNIIEREITEDEINTFDNCFYGLDWGFIHPTAFMGVHYDPNRLKLYIFNEIYGSGIKNRQLVEMLEPWKDCWITADSEDKKSNEDMMDWGYNIQGAYKPPGSREYSMKWLSGLAEIVIDPVRCPNAAREFTAYEFERTKDGELTSMLPKIHDDTIDGVRYAMCPVWRNRGK